MKKLISVIIFIAVLFAAIAQEKNPVNEIKFTNLLPRWSPITNFAFSPDGKYLVTYQKDSTIVVEETRSGSKLWEYRPKDKEDVAERFAFAPDNQIGICQVNHPNMEDLKSGTKYLAGNAKIYLFDLETGENKEVIDLQDRYSRFFAFGNKGQYLVASVNNGVAVYDRKSLKWIAKQNIAMLHQYVNFSLDDKYIIIADDYGTGVYNTKKIITEKYPATIRRDRASYKEAYVYNEKCIYMNSDYSKVLILHSNILSLYKFLGDKPIKDLGGDTTDILHACLAMTPDGKWAATAHKDNTIKIWDLKAGKVVRTENVYEPVICLAFRPDGKELVYLLKRAE